MNACAPVLVTMFLPLYGVGPVDAILISVLSIAHILLVQRPMKVILGVLVVEGLTFKWEGFGVTTMGHP